MDDDDDDDDNYNYNAIANNNDSYFLNFCDDNEEESWEQKQLKRAIEESIREASVSSASASGASVSSQPRTTATTASSSSSTTTASTTVSTTAETLSSSSLTDEAEQLVLAQTIQLSQIEQHEKEIKESMMMNRAIKESHKSHYEDTQNNISMQLANQLQKQAEPEDIAYAIHESFQSNEKRKLHNQLNNQYTKYKIARSEEKQMGCWDCQQNSVRIRR
jgi:hypothetical protein